MKKPTIYKTSLESFWALLDQLLAERPFNKRLLDSILGTSLLRVGSNKFFEFYESGDDVLKGISVERVELRVKKSASNIGLILIDIREPCVTRAEIQKRHAALSITPASGDSSSELIYYTAEYPWGSLSFGFPLEHSDCLSRVVLEAPGTTKTP